MTHTSPSKGSNTEQTNHSLSTSFRLNRRKFLLRTAATLTVGAVGYTACLASIDAKLELIRLECEALMQKKSTVVDDVGTLDWTNARVAEYNKHGEERSWDPRFLIGDFDLDIVHKNGEEKWVGRCGGFARHWISSAARDGFDEVRMYLCSYPKDKRHINQIRMHFYGVIGHNDTMWTLQYGSEFECKPLKRGNFKQTSYYSKVEECFRCVRPGDTG